MGVTGSVTETGLVPLIVGEVVDMVVREELTERLRRCRE